MAKTKNTAGLAQPGAPSRWALIRQAERVGHGTAQPIRMSWKTAQAYTCPELQHRSRGQNTNSIVLGKRVEQEGVEA